MSGDRLYRIGLPALLGLVALSQLVGWGADAPLEGDRDLSLSTDGAWYAGTALDLARGGAPERGGPYDRPVFTALVRAAAWIVGPGERAASLVAALSSLGALLLTASAARRAGGPLAGLAAGGLLALDLAFLAHSRAPNIYSACALVGAAVLACAARAGDGRRGWWIAAWAIALAGVLTVKSVLVLLLPPLLVAEWCATPRPSLKPRRWTFAGILAAAALLLGAGLAAWAARAGWLLPNYHKLRDYLTVGPDGLAASTGLVERILGLEDRLGLASLSPGLLALLLLDVVRPARSGSPALRLARGHVLFSLLALAPLVYSPIRYLIPAYPALALLAGLGASRLLRAASGHEDLALQSGTEAPGREPAAGAAGERAPGEVAVEAAPASLPRLAARSLLASYLVLQGGLALTGGRASWALWALAAASLSAGILLCMSRRSADRLREAVRACPRLGRALIAAWAVLFLAAPGLRSGQAHAERRYSVRNAGQELGAIVSPCAYLTGTFAHALTWESGLRRKHLPLLRYGGGRLGRTLRAEGFTHLVTDVPRDPASVFGPFRADGAALEEVWQFTVRGVRVGLYRFPWAAELCPPSDFERGLDALRAGKREDGRELLRRALAAEGRFAAAACTLGVSLLEDGQPGEGERLLERALEWNPDELRAARALVDLRLKRGELARARQLLLHIAARDPEDRKAQDLAERIARHGR